MFPAIFRLGAASAVAVDCDPLSIRMCAVNAELNGMQDSLEVILCAEDPAKVRQGQSLMLVWGTNSHALQRRRLAVLYTMTS